MLAYKIVCIDIGLDSYYDFFEQIVDLTVNINVKRESCIVRLAAAKSFYGKRYIKRPDGLHTFHDRKP